MANELIEAPEGWVLVPKEPTREMLAAGANDCASWWTKGRSSPVYGNEPGYIYLAMIAAAPSSPSARDVVPTEMEWRSTICDANQLIDGWEQKGVTLTDWDNGVRRRLSKMARELEGATNDVESTDTAARLRVRDEVRPQNGLDGAENQTDSESTPAQDGALELVPRKISTARGLNDGPSPSARDVVPTTPFIDGYFAQRIRNGETPPGCPAPDAAPTQSTLANLRKQIARTISDLGFWEQRIESALPSAPTPGMVDDEAFKRGVERGMIYAAGLVAKWSTLGLKTIEDGIRSRATSVAERLASDGARRASPAEGSHDGN